MKKVITGILIGMILALPIGAHAEEIKHMIGKTVEGSFPIKLNDTQLVEQAIVIDGTSYLPVRAIGDALNLEVGFDADLGITLSSKKAALSSTKQAESVTKVNRIKEIIEQRKDIKKRIAGTDDTNLQAELRKQDDAIAAESRQLIVELESMQP